MTTFLPSTSPALDDLAVRPPSSALFKPAGIVRDAALEPIADKVARGERLSLADGETLFTTPDIWGVCELAEGVKRRMHGGIAYYNVNRHINYSNVCALSCKFCAFYRKRGDDGSYEMDVAKVVEEAKKAADAGATELHIVGGLHPYLPFSYYTDMLGALRDAVPMLHLKAFTAVEIVHLARIAKVYQQDESGRRQSMAWVLGELKNAGLGSLPGGGAEVFDDRVHDEAFKGKIRSDVWLDVHRAAHELGLNTNATMLYGHVERRRERLVHMEMLRTVQDEALQRIGIKASGHQGIEEEGTEASRHRGIEQEGTEAPRHPGIEVTLTVPGATLPTPAMNSRGGYFQTIIPLPFFPDKSELERLPGPGGLENLRTLAVARLMLDNFPHVKAFWIMQTLGMAQLMLSAGADDIDGTVVWYDITKVGGVHTHQEQGVWDLQKAIREAGLEPVERDTLYRRVIRGQGGPRDWRVE